VSQDEEAESSPTTMLINELRKCKGSEDPRGAVHGTMNLSARSQAKIGWRERIKY
jgi:hypothetical protein